MTSQIITQRKQPKLVIKKSLNEQSLLVAVLVLVAGKKRKQIYDKYMAVLSLPIYHFLKTRYIYKNNILFITSNI